MPGNMNELNILVTLDENYIPVLNTMIVSLIKSNPNCFFNIYLLHSSVRQEAVSDSRLLLGDSGSLSLIEAKNDGLENAPTTSRYPQEIYYRIFAAQYLPDTIDRILYLDPDIIVNGSLLPLYQLPMEDYYFAAASHISGFLRMVNGIRLDMDEEGLYINSGVMLMNLKLLREEQNCEDVFDFINQRKRPLFLPDQDIISSLYGTKIYALDPFRYNMTERLYIQHAPFDKNLNMDWVRKNSVIIHYCGRNKPWKENYLGELDVFYREALSSMNDKLKAESR